MALKQQSLYQQLAQRILLLDGAMADYQMSSLSYEINYEGAKLARVCADKPRYVAGVLGPTNRTASISADVNVSFDLLVEALDVRLPVMISGKVYILNKLIKISSKLSFLGREKLIITIFISQ